jgi:hypothetical protein
MRREARGGADRAVDVNHTSAGSTNQVVVIAADPILEASRRSRGLDAPDQPRGGQKAQGVVYRLQGGGTNLGPDSLGDGVANKTRNPSIRGRQDLSGQLGKFPVSRWAWTP